MRKTKIAQLLELDPDLGEGLAPGERAVAARALPVPVAGLRKGPWQPGGDPAEPGQLGYLIFKGLLVRRIEVGQGCSIELLGRGELLRPWQEDTSSFCKSSWEVVEPTALAQLGPGLMPALSRWPALVSNLLARGIRRSRALAADAAAANIIGLEERLLTALWQLAETWGETQADGVLLSIRLPHRLLAELTGARRPSITTAIGELKRSGRLDCAASGYWILRGDPPG
jgi:CRP/FNR family transcriptional regulator, cyclic AMP receptor protein